MAKKLFTTKIDPVLLLCLKRSAEECGLPQSRWLEATIAVRVREEPWFREFQAALSLADRLRLEGAERAGVEVPLGRPKREYDARLDPGIRPELGR